MPDKKGINRGDRSVHLAKRQTEVKKVNEKRT